MSENFYYYVSDHNNNWAIIEVDECIYTHKKSSVVKLKRIIKLGSVILDFVCVRKTEDNFGRERNSIYIDMNKVSTIKNESLGNVKKAVDKISIINAIIEKI